MTEGAWVGISAVQGGVAPHEAVLAKLGIPARRILRAGDLVGASGLILPGGESTAQARLLAADSGALGRAVQAFIGSGAPVLATCAGLILLARWGRLDVEIERNGWGRQIDSFEATADDGRTSVLCIRAPRIHAVRPPTRVLLTLDGAPIRVQRGRIFGAIDHPELIGDLELHRRVFQKPFLQPADPPKLAAHAGDRRPRSTV